MRWWHHAVVVFLVLVPYGIGQADDVLVECRLGGGTLVRLPAQSCSMEGGTVMAVPSASTPGEKAGEPAQAAIPGNVLTGNARLDALQLEAAGILNKPVNAFNPLNRNPEGILRSARFDDCKLSIEEVLHIEYGNVYSVWKDFRINSSIDFRGIDKEAYRVLGKIVSKGGELSGTAVSIEEHTQKGGNNIAISVLNLRDGKYVNYTSYGPSAYWDAPREDFWMADGYGYVKSSGLNVLAKDKIRILLILNSQEEAVTLKNALDEIHSICNAGSVEEVGDQ